MILRNLEESSTGRTRPRHKMETDVVVLNVHLSTITMVKTNRQRVTTFLDQLGLIGGEEWIPRPGITIARMLGSEAISYQSPVSKDERKIQH